MRHEILNVTLLLGLALVIAGCGGAAKSSKAEMNALAREAPPPPDAKQGGQLVNRKLSKEAAVDFAAAVKFFNAQAEGGWTTQECTAAADRFIAIAREHDKMVEAHFNAGVAYQKCGDQKRAEEQYQQALKINPSHAPSLTNLGEIYQRGGNDKIGEQYYEKALVADIQTVAANNNMAWVWYQRLRQSPGNKDAETRAIQHLQRVLAVDNDNVVAYTIMGLIYMEGSDKNKNRLDVARLLLDRAKKSDPKYAPLYNALGLLALKRSNNVAGALENFRTAVGLDKSFIEARMNLAQIVLSFRKYDEAETLFREVLALKPSAEVRYAATNGLGVALRGLGSQLRTQGNMTVSEQKINEALAKYNEAAKLDAARGDAYFNMGLLYKDYRTNGEPADNLKAYQEAKGYFQQYLERKDGTPDKIAEAKDHIEDCDKYVKILQQAIDFQRNNPPPPPTPAAAAPAPAQPAPAAPGAPATPAPAAAGAAAKPK